jgi:hypothetical protein
LMVLDFALDNFFFLFFLVVLVGFALAQQAFYHLSHSPSFLGFSSFIFYFLFSYVHTMIGSLLPTSPHPLPHAPTPSFPSRNCFALTSNFVEERV